MKTREKLNKLKQDILNRIRQYAEKGNMEDIQRYTELIPRIQMLSNSLDEIDIKVNILERSINEAYSTKTKSKKNDISNINEPISDTLSARDKARIKRNEFLNILESKGIRLEQFKGVIYKYKKTSGLVGIAYSGEKSGSWFLGLPELEYEIIVLLCLKENDDMYIIIFPKEFCSKYINYLSKSNGQLKFSLRKKRNELLLYTKLKNVNVSQNIENYSAFYN